MTLVEAVVAAAVVLLVVAAASNAVAAVDQLTARIGERDAAEAQVAATLEQLRSLPFAGGGGAEGADLLSCVFPHADPARNSADAAYHDTALAGRPAGTFLTIEQTDVRSRDHRRHVRRGHAGGFAPVAVARLGRLRRPAPRACCPRRRCSCASRSTGAAARTPAWPRVQWWSPRDPARPGAASTAGPS